MPIISFGPNITVSCVLFIASSDAQFCMNFSFNTTVHCSLLSNIFTIASPQISSINGTSIFINFFSFGFSIICSYEKKGIDLFRNLKDEPHVCIMPSNSNTFFMPNAKSTLSCISDTNVNTSNI